MHMAKPRNITPVRREPSLVFSVNICYRLGHPERQCRSSENMPAVDCTDQWIHE